VAEINGVPLVLRREWGARRPRGTTALPPSRARGVALHYTASHAPAAHRDCAASVRAIQAMHMAAGGLGVPNGGSDIAYSHLACIHGSVFRLRGLGVRTGANGSNEGNSFYYAVVVLGTDRAGRADITPELRRALTRLFLWYDAQIPGGARFRPHSAFVGTACPGDELRAFLRAGGWRP
jgi:hypothetical protein